MSFYGIIVFYWIIPWILELQCECTVLYIDDNGRVKRKNDEAAPPALVVIGEVLLDNVNDLTFFRSTGTSANLPNF